MNLVLHTLHLLIPTWVALALLVLVNRWVWVCRSAWRLVPTAVLLLVTWFPVQVWWVVR